MADAKSVWKWRKIVESFYVESRSCVRVGADVSEWFPINVGSRECCMMSPWLFNVCMDYDVVPLVRDVNASLLARGLKLQLVNAGRFEINHFCLQMMQH